MKKVKYFICTLLIVVSFLFNGELFIFYLDNFQESYFRSSFAFVDLPESITNEDIVLDFINAGKKHKVDFFMIDSNIKSAFEKEIIIYGTDNALKNLQKQGILEKEYTSLFVGKTKVHYVAFSKIKNIVKYEYCYYLGDKTKQDEFDCFKAELIDKYGGGFPKLYGSDKETWFNLFSVWTIVLSLILIITVYEVLYKKKETMIRIILGENLNTIFLKNVFLDTGAFSLIFLITPILLKGLSNVYFKISYIITFFIFFIFINILINATIFKVDFKQNVAGINGGKLLLTSNYVLKIITTILTIIILSSNFVIIAKGVDAYHQRDFFENHKGYSYYQLNYKMDNYLGKTENDDAMVNQIFYKRFQEKSLQYVDLSENFHGDYPVVLINRTSMKELIQEWPALAKVQKDITEEKVYILMPTNIELNSKAYINAKKNYNCFFGNQFKNNIETIKYEGNVNLVGTQNRIYYKSQMRKTPIILFNNTIQQISEEQAEDADWYAYDTMYDISPKEFQKFIKEFQLEDQIVVKSNVLEVYEHNWEIISRSMKVSLVLSTFLILLEMSLIIFIVMLEYQFNAVEMALKKIYGYTLFERNRKIIKITLFSSLFSILGAFILNTAFGIHEGLNLIWGGIILSILELVYIIKKAKSIEKVKVPGILKGERI